ncbi:MAG TPA: AarF/ABC1/UbiB kinase family protein, partial [Tepidisphaeraceae bacterium]|nr:AarF/ABC1/UbiB kinase family protein [Tepidisphaeraceae bacterium]
MPVPTVISSKFRFAGDLARAADVARVLAKYGLAAWLADVDWDPIHNALRSEGGESLPSQPVEARLRLALTDLGTTFIKLGQMLSTRPDLVGQPLAAELSKLQQRTPPDAPDVATAVVERELGRPVEEIFRQFEGDSLASASIGQVHRARLKSGRRAVVKIQHPGIEGVIRRDLDILGFLAEIAEMNETLRRYQPVSLIREFGRTILNELDFRRELRNLQVFRRNFAKDQTVVFPKPYPELASGRVLTMEYLRGSAVSDTKKLDKLDIDRQELARRGANVFVEMIFRDGFYHADPHPGNFLVLPDGKIGLLDAGMVGRIDEKFRRQIEDMLMAAGDLDAVRLTDAVVRVCGIPPQLDRDALSADLTELFQEYGTRSVGDFDVGGALTAVTDILHEHKLILPSRLSMLIKCLILLEGTGRLLSPKFSLAELLAPWRKRVLWSRFSPEARLKNARQLYVDFERMAETLPRVLSNVVDLLEAGKFVLRMEHRHLRSAANRLTVGILVSAILLGSTILLAGAVKPTLWGISVPGVLGYTVALVVALRVIWV